MDILYQFNDKYAPYAAVSMTSLFENNKDVKKISVHILGEELSQASEEKLRALSDIYGRHIFFVDTTGLVEKMKSLNMPTYRGSYAANMRLFVDYLFEQNENAPKRLLYLDADTIVTGSLESLFLLPIKTLGMVYDTLGNFHKYGIGLSENEGYYNSGVILYDVDKWIKGNYTEKIVEHVRNVRASYPSPDQDLINVVMREEITPILPEYNFQPHLRDYSYRQYMRCFSPHPFYDEDEIGKANENPVILHAFRYLGEFAWHKGSIHPFLKEFDRYLSLSTFKDYIKQPANTSPVMKIEKIMYRVLPKGVFLGIFKVMHARFYKKADKMSKKNQISKRM